MSNRLDACLNYTLTPERLSELSRSRRTSSKKYYSKNRDKCLALRKEWGDRNQNKVRGYAIKSEQKRRSAINGLGDGDLDIFFGTDKVCPITGSTTVDLEHIFPVSKGWLGNNRGNLMWLQSNINSSKGNKNVFTWLSELTQQDLDYLLREESNSISLQQFKTAYKEELSKQAELLGMTYSEYKTEYNNKYKED